MAVLLNDTDMERMLESIRPEGETYTGKAWGTIMAGTAKMLALGALSNVSCYVGVPERSLVNNSVTARVKNQKQGMQTICSTLESACGA